MPLNKRCSEKAFQDNIKQAIKDGKPQPQAVAISINTLKGACGVKSKKRMKVKDILKKEDSDWRERLDVLYKELTE